MYVYVYGCDQYQSLTVKEGEKTKTKQRALYTTPHHTTPAPTFEAHGLPAAAAALGHLVAQQLEVALVRLGPLLLLLLGRLLGLGRLRRHHLGRRARQVRLLEGDDDVEAALREGHVHVLPRGLDHLACPPHVQLVARALGSGCVFWLGCGGWGWACSLDCPCERTNTRTPGTAAAPHVLHCTQDGAITPSRHYAITPLSRHHDAPRRARPP